MRLAATTFVLALILTASAALGVAYLDGRLGHHDAGIRAIHYDTNYSLSSQRRGGLTE
jgi:hypothetical protein